jgi:hypothetical protein
MSGIATAVIGAAVIGGVATTIASNKAASATKSASDAAIRGEQGALAQQAALSQPYRDLGTSNIPTYQSLLSGNKQKTEATLQSMPGYQFALDTGTEAAKRSSAASGLNLSGNQVGAVESFGVGLADSTYQTELANLLQPIQLGQAAAAGQAANIGATANTVGSQLIGQGNTQAGIDANQAASYTKLAGGAANSLLTYNTLQGLNNPGGGNPQNLGGSTPVAPDGSTLTYDASGNITGSAPVAAVP